MYRTPSRFIQRMCSRTLAMLRWRKRALNMNGVWQNEQAYTQPRVISIAFHFPAGALNAGKSSSGRRSPGPFECSRP